MKVTYSHVDNTVESLKSEEIFFRKANSDLISVFKMILIASHVIFDKCSHPRHKKKNREIFHSELHLLKLNI